MKTFRNIRKESPILWAVDISDGENTSTVYARLKRDIKQFLKLHDFVAA